MTDTLPTKRILIFAAAFIVAFAIILIPQTKLVYADPLPANYAKKITVLGSGSNSESFFYYLDMGNKGEIKSMKSSKTNVVKPDKKDPPVFYAKKSGASKLTLKVKKNGKTKTYKCTVKVVKYKNAFNKFMFGGKDLKSKYNKTTHYYNYKYNKDTAVLKITPTKQWKIKYIKHFWWSFDTDIEGAEKVKNGAKIKLHGGDSFEIYMYNTKYKFNSSFYFGLENDM